MVLNRFLLFSSLSYVSLPTGRPELPVQRSAPGIPSFPPGKPFACAGASGSVMLVRRLHTYLMCRLRKTEFPGFPRGVLTYFFPFDPFKPHILVGPGGWGLQGWADEWGWNEFASLGRGRRS